MYTKVAVQAISAISLPIWGVEGSGMVADFRDRHRMAQHDHTSVKGLTERVQRSGKWVRTSCCPIDSQYRRDSPGKCGCAPLHQPQLAPCLAVDAHVLSCG
jgi:hypothetical protein